MMGRGAEGGCGTQEKFFRPISRGVSTSRQHQDGYIGFHDQARKALTERCPFDSTEGDAVAASRVSTLPVGLADSLSRYTQSRHKRHKKSDSQAPSQQQQQQQAHAQPPRSASASSTNIWADTEEYFRPLVLSDVDNLAPFSSLACLATHSCFTIPSLRTATTASTTPAPATVNCDSSCVVEGVEDKKKEFREQQCMEIDGGGEGAGPDKQPLASTPATETTASPPMPSGIEWLLGCRNKILLTSERPSKKRKLLGSDAGLDRLRVERPYGKEPNLHLCHLCCLGDLDQPSNQLLVCDFCKVAIHQKCYGVQNAPLGPWLCSWCKCSNDAVDGSDLSSLRPCLLCPKLGGALKPLHKDDTDTATTASLKFVHLICCQWMPEVYVEDTQTMEPVLNFKGIKETRKKLVCNICKVKHGACVRCSNGTCRTSFHPICAREAGHRMEIWGKTGIENVELRAFCSKHSDLQDIGGTQQLNNRPFEAAGSNSFKSEHLPVTLLANKPQKLNIGHKNGERSMVNVSTLEKSSNNLDNSEISLEQDNPTSNARHKPQYLGAQLPVSTESPEGDVNGNSVDLVLALKKLVDRGKAVVSDVALEIGISSELLAATLTGEHTPFPDMQCKILKWLKNHAFICKAQWNMKSGDNVAMSSRVGDTGSDGPNSVAIESNASFCAVPVKPVPPRRTKTNIKILKDNKVVSSLKGAFVQKIDDGMVIDGVKVKSVIPNGDLEENGTNDRFLSLGDSGFEEKVGMEKISGEHFGQHDMGSAIPQPVPRVGEFANGNLLENNQVEVADVSVGGAFTKFSGEHLVSSVDVVTPAVPGFISGELSSSCIHPIIQKKLMQLQNGTCVKQENLNLCDCTSDAIKVEQLLKARNMGILQLSAEDEVEGQLIYLQNKLLDNAVASKKFSDELLSNVIKALPEEINSTRKQRWDSVLVNQYLCGLREAKKQGRKEKRHKEAQAVLAAATAVAAASSRISSFRKDVQDEASQQEVPLKVMPRAKETLSRLAVARVSSEKPSGFFQLTPVLKGNPQLCDVCKRSETMLNPVLVCCNCKVPVHLSCYRGLKDPSGPFYCELCEEMLPCRPFPTNSREESRVLAHCGLCGGTTGAFRKSTDGQWVHAFCAEWLLESTFRRGQPNLVEGMGTISKGAEVCCICYRKIGSCIKCNFGNCQSTFHPSCARNTGLYMHVKTGGGKLQHKAYCEKHSLEQREKADAHQHGPEELRGIKQIRVELERVRLLCERIIKREKLKRELVLCSHDILGSKRDSVTFSVLFRSPFFLNDVSSESATTSLRGHVDDNRSCSEAMQRSEDITMDSAISGKRRVMHSATLDVDQKTDDSSTSQRHFTRTPTDRVQLSGKQLPQRPVSVFSRNLTDDAERKLKSRKHTETFQKELVMTSDQASVQNQRLPKGFAYVPVLCLPKEKPVARETGSLDSVEPDG